jgi:hypothetical protein
VRCCQYSRQLNGPDRNSIGSIVVDGRPDEDLFALERVRMTFVRGRRLHG